MSRSSKELIAEPVALGFRAHTGWAAVVAVSGTISNPVVFHRSRIDLLAGTPDLSRFVYHAASKLALPNARELVDRARDAAARAAEPGIQKVITFLRSSGKTVVLSVIPVGTTKVPADLDAILRSHALIHAAEGELYRNALISASEARGLRVSIIRERDIWKRGAETFGIAVDALRDQIGAFGKKLGPPWSEDQKLATTAALEGLARLLPVSRP